MQLLNNSKYLGLGLKFFKTDINIEKNLMCKNLIKAAVDFESCIFHNGLKIYASNSFTGSLVLS